MRDIQADHCRINYACTVRLCGCEHFFIIRVREINCGREFDVIISGMISKKFFFKYHNSSSVCNNVHVISFLRN